jgi:hypothetical protein
LLSLIVSWDIMSVSQSSSGEKINNAIYSCFVKADVCTKDEIKKGFDKTHDIYVCRGCDKRLKLWKVSSGKRPSISNLRAHVPVCPCTKVNVKDIFAKAQADVEHK